jgi:hypothetical protein
MKMMLEHVSRETYVGEKVERFYQFNNGMGAIVFGEPGSWRIAPIRYVLEGFEYVNEPVDNATDEMLVDYLTEIKGD